MIVVLTLAINVRVDVKNVVHTVHGLRTPCCARYQSWQHTVISSLPLRRFALELGRISRNPLNILVGTCACATALARLLVAMEADRLALLVVS